MSQSGRCLCLHWCFCGFKMTQDDCAQHLVINNVTVVRFSSYLVPCTITLRLDNKTPPYKCLKTLEVTTVALHDLKNSQLLCFPMLYYSYYTVTYLTCDGLKRKNQQAQSSHYHFGGSLHQCPILSVMRGMRKSKWHPHLGNNISSLNPHAEM